MSLTLVPDRLCGACTTCCVVLPIDVPALRKPTGEPCRHCGPNGGCTVYSIRPEPCRNWECLWKFFENLGDDWRPDRSGILLRPEEISKGVITIMVLQRSAFLHSHAFVTTVGAWLDNGVRISLSRPSKPGFYPSSADVTHGLLPTVRAQNPQAFLQRLEYALDVLDGFQTAPDGLPSCTTLTEAPLS